jgi:hypothetical protein
VGSNKGVQLSEVSQWQFQKKGPKSGFPKLGPTLVVCNWWSLSGNSPRVVRKEWSQNGVPSRGAPKGGPPRGGSPKGSSLEACPPKGFPGRVPKGGPVGWVSKGGFPRQSRQMGPSRAVAWCGGLRLHGARDRGDRFVVMVFLAWCGFREFFLEVVVVVICWWK